MPLAILFLIKLSLSNIDSVHARATSVQHIVIGHSGAQTGCSAQLLINRNNRSVVAVLTNNSGDWEEVIGLTAQLMNIAGESVAAE